jgi:S-adenosylmethionine:tRNA ribosyltransferase-isomerase
MKLSDFDYNLPKELIAQEPIKPRDHSRLLILNKKTGEIEHKHFYDIVDCLQTGDVLVLNNSKVFPARLIGKKKDTGGKIEFFLITPPFFPPLIRGGMGRGKKEEIWECLIGGRGAKIGLVVEFDRKLIGKIVKNNGDGTWEIKFNKSGNELMKIVEKIGLVPLPPYIKRKEQEKSDTTNYQTIYADEKKIGSVAAPTAGFHFTPALMKKIKAKGVQIEYVTLHVGLGTFAPVKVDDITKHKMHSEWAEIDKKTMEHIVRAKLKGRRIIAVGTTSARTLESSNCHTELNSASRFKTMRSRNKFGMTNLSGWTNIFIYPGYKFKVVDALITNFHLPKSTLLMLVTALAGKKNIDKAYQEAIKRKYRFFSYGDAMFIYSE